MYICTDFIVDTKMNCLYELQGISANSTKIGDFFFPEI